MSKISISSLEDRYEGFVSSFLHDAEVLTIFFTSPQGVQTKWLKSLGFKPAEIKIIIRVAKLFANRKAKLLFEKVPKNREGVILIENDVLASLYEPRLLRVVDETRECALCDVKTWLVRTHPGSVILDSKRIDAVEDLLKLQGSSVDFLVFTNKGIISYVLELI